MKIRIGELTDAQPRLLEFGKRESSPQRLPERVLLLPLPRRFPLYKLDRIVPAAWRVLAPTVVIRAHSEEAEEIRRSTHLREIWSGRFQNASLHLLYLDQERSHHELAHLDPSPAAATVIDNGSLVSLLRAADIRALSYRPRALLPPSDEFHYEAPNGAHYGSFLRVGTAIQGQEALDRIAFWLAPHLVDKPVLFGDAPYLAPVLLNAKAYLYDCGLISTHYAEEHDHLHSYDEDGDVLRDRLRDLARHRRLSKFLFLRSVSSTGNSAKRVLARAREVDFQDIAVVSLFATPESSRAEEGTVFCRLDSGFKRLEPCDRCERGVPLVRIDSSTYHLDLAAAVQPARITRKDAQAATEFFDRYKDLEAVTIHTDRSDGTRHHAIHIDTSPLFQGNDHFRAKFLDHAASFEPVDCVLVPDHERARELGRAAAERLGCTFLACDEHKLGELGSGDAGLLQRALSVLIVDDAIVSGERVYGYKAALGRLGLLQERASVGVLVGVSRPETTEQLDGILDMFRPAFRSVETILLPNWGDDLCPWCVELKALQEYFDRADPKTAPLKARLERLYQKRGLTDNIFLYWDESGRSPLQLSKNTDAAFARELQQAELFANVASAVQTLRDSGKLNREFILPVARVLAPAYTLSGRYFDDILTAAILRGCRPHDLRTTSCERELRRVLDRQIGREEYVQKRPELIWAVTEFKLPPLPDLERTLQGAEPGLRGFLKDRLQRLRIGSRSQAFD